MDEIVSQAKETFVRATEKMAALLAATPDDRINWAPSATSRTPLQIVAHSAAAIKSITDMLDGRPFEITDSVQADRFFRDWEVQFSSREEVMTLLEENSAAHIALLDSLTPDRLEAAIQLPFGLGTAPLAVGLPFAAGHTQGHIAQLEYIQSIYGDRDWHM